MLVITVRPIRDCAGESFPPGTPGTLVRTPRGTCLLRLRHIPRTLVVQEDDVQVAPAHLDTPGTRSTPTKSGIPSTFSTPSTPSIPFTPNTPITPPMFDLFLQSQRRARRIRHALGHLTRPADPVALALLLRRRGRGLQRMMEVTGGTFPPEYARALRRNDRKVRRMLGWAWYQRLWAKIKGAP